MIDPDPQALSALPEGYRSLLRRLLDVAAADERIRAVWLSGSLGRGVADAGSDLDVVLTVADDAFDEFVADWRGWLARVTPTVLAKELLRLPGSWYSLTPDCERLDVVTERAGRPRGSRQARRLVLDRDGTFGSPPDPPGPPGPAAPAAGPDPARLAGLAEEFLRQQAIFPASVVARADWLLGVVGIQQVHLMLYELFVEANQPLPKLGVKQWSAKLTPRQRGCCADLPQPAPERDSVLRAMRAAAAAFRAEAREILAAHQVPWPAALDGGHRLPGAGAWLVTGRPARPGPRALPGGAARHDLAGQGIDRAGDPGHGAVGHARRSERPDQVPGDQVEVLLLNPAAPVGVAHARPRVGQRATERGREELSLPALQPAHVGAGEEPA